MRKLRTNLINIWQAANDPNPNSQLDVATISAHLHHNLQQSAFTDKDTHGNAVFHAAGSADIPASPFRVNSGRSSYQTFGSIIPLHHSVNLITPPPLQYPPINDVATIQALQAATIPFQGNPAVIHPIPIQGEIDDAIEEYANCFSNDIVLRQLRGGGSNCALLSTGRPRARMLVGTGARFSSFGGRITRKHRQFARLESKRKFGVFCRPRRM